MKKYSKAFTFIEILIALTIFSIIALSLYSTFFSATSVWKRSADENRLYQEARWSLETIAKELRNAIILDYRKSYSDFSVFEGNSNSISFLCVTEDGIKKVSYFLEEDGPDVLLKRQEIALIDAFQVWEPEVAVEIFSSLVSQGGLKFKYAYISVEAEEEIGWQDTWQDNQSLPKGVKIELILKNPRSQEIKIIFNKTVFIPRGVIFETIESE